MRLAYWGDVEGAGVWVGVQSGGTFLPLQSSPFVLREILYYFSRAAEYRRLGGKNSRNVLIHGSACHESLRVLQGWFLLMVLGESVLRLSLLAFGCSLAVFGVLGLQVSTLTFPWRSPYAYDFVSKFPFHMWTPVILV